MNTYDAQALEKIKAYYIDATSNISWVKGLWDHMYFIKDWRNNIYYLNISNCTPDFKDAVKKLISVLDDFTQSGSVMTGAKSIKVALDPTDFSSVEYVLDRKSRKTEQNNITNSIKELEEISARN